MRKKIIIILILIITGIAGYRLTVFFKSRFFSEKKEEVDSRKIPVKAVSVKNIDLVIRKKLTGDIIGTEVVNVFSHVPGKIHSILKKEGQKVWRGVTLFKINRDIVGMEYKLAMDELTLMEKKLEESA